jgi:cation transport ATPase
MIVEALVVGGTAYAGLRAYRRIKANGGLRLPRFTRPQTWLEASSPTVTVQTTPPPSPTLQQANQMVGVASTALGLTVIGAWLTTPALSLASIPLTLYVFAPTFQTAWRSLREQRRIDNPVLDATRVVLCVIMRYDLVLALNGCLQAVSQKFFVRAEDEFRQELATLFGDTQIEAWLYANGAELPVPLHQLTTGAVVVLGPGDTIPADGLVLYGTAWLDQRLATGDPEPAWKWKGERVAATSVVQSGQLYVQLEQAGASPLLPTIRDTLADTVEQKTLVQQMGERSADRMAPRSLIAFAIALPLMGPNQAAAFLTTGFGNNLRTLGPYAVRNFLIPAAQQGILIKDARALEKANLVNTIIFDSRILQEPTVRAEAKAVIHALRQRPWLLASVSKQRFAIYVLVDQEEEGRRLTAELGLDDYLVESSVSARATLLERLHQGGRVIGYVGRGDTTDALVMAKAQVAIAWRGLESIATNAAQVVLVDQDLARLPRFFELAAAFGVKQGFSLIAPIGLDLVDIATTIFIHFGLVYSIMFNYAGLWLGAAYARPPLLATKEEETAAATTDGLPTLLLKAPAL